MNVETDILVTAEAWAELDWLEELTLAVVRRCTEVSNAKLALVCELCVTFTDDAAIRALNARWRGIDQPTNVLSFETPGELLTKPALGDIVIAYETAAREAKEQDKTLRAHVAHLIVHGFLHLIGHDHKIASEADAMERLERRVMAALGLPDPYEGTQPIEEASNAHAHVED